MIKGLLLSDNILDPKIISLLQFSVYVIYLIIIYTVFGEFGMAQQLYLNKIYWLPVKWPIYYLIILSDCELIVLLDLIYTTGLMFLIYHIMMLHRLWLLFSRIW